MASEIRSERKRIKSKTILSFTILGLVVVPILAASLFSVRSADDFCLNNEFLSYQGTGLLSKGLNFAYHWYFQAGGNYSVIFTCGIMSHLVSKAPVLLPVYLFISNLLCMISVAFFVSLYVQYLGWEKTEEVTSLFSNKEISFSLFLGVLVSWWGHRSYPEIFSWLSGNMNYCRGLILVCLLFSCMLKTKRSGAKKYLIGMFLLAFDCGGLSTLLLGIANFSAIYLCFREYRDYGKLNKAFCAGTAALLLFSFIDIAAPGNYRRHAMVDGSGVHFLRAIYYSFVEMKNGYYFFLGNPLFLLSLLFVLYIGIKESRRIILSGKRVFADLIFAIVFQFLGCYPVVLGYSIQGTGLPNRTLFIFDFTVYFSLIFWLFEFGVFLAHQLEVTDEIRRAAGISVLIGVIIIVSLNPVALVDGASWKKTTADLLKGRIPAYSAEVKDVLSFVEESDEKNVVLDPLPLCPETFHALSLGTTPDDWRNIGVAQYYDKETISVRK